MSDIKIIAAIYGASQGSKDVTTIVQDMVDKGETNFRVDNRHFGDPAVRVTKSLAVLYKHGVRKDTRVCKEGEMVDLV